MGRRKVMRIDGRKKKEKPSRYTHLHLALIVVAFLIMSGATVLYQINRRGETSGISAVKLVVPEDGQVRIPLAGITVDEIEYFECEIAPGHRTQFLVLESPAHTYRTALDASEISTKGIHQHDGSIICGHCRLKFTPAQIGVTSGGCYPIPVANRVVGDTLVIEQSELQRADSMVNRSATTRSN